MDGLGFGTHGEVDARYFWMGTKSRLIHPIFEPFNRPIVRKMADIHTNNSGAILTILWIAAGEFAMLPSISQRGDIVTIDVPRHLKTKLTARLIEIASRLA